MPLKPVRYFNSIKVQLKRPVQPLGGDVAKFQFHKGTIKTRLYCSLTYY